MAEIEEELKSFAKEAQDALAEGSEEPEAWSRILEESMATIRGSVASWKQMKVVFEKERAILNKIREDIMGRYEKTKKQGEELKAVSGGMLADFREKEGMEKSDEVTHASLIAKGERHLEIISATCSRGNELVRTADKTQTDGSTDVSLGSSFDFGSCEYSCCGSDTCSECTVYDDEIASCTCGDSDTYTCDI